MKICAATGNAGKLRELRRILEAQGHEVVSQKELGITIEPDETGTTFEENALIKAETICKASGLPTIADDSGLCVDALEGAPGVYSARYCGRHGDDEANNDKLLENMQDVPAEQRGAKFVAAVCFILPTGRHLTCRGECPGKVAFARLAGDYGFGYDPLFIPDECGVGKAEKRPNTEGRSYAQLTPDDLLLDLYCGMGTIGLSMVDHCRELVGVEIVPEAIESAKANAARMGDAIATKSRFFCADAGAAATRLAAEGLRPDVIVLDPPRKGCDEATLSAVVKMNPQRVVYVSCNPATAARDAKWLETQGYRTEKVQPVDLFPRTKHVETVVLLSHKKADSYIHIDVEFGEGEGKIPVDSIAKRAEAYKPKEKVTYKMIKEYIEAKYGFKVHTAYIAEVKRNLGLPMYDAPNAVEELKQPRKHPTPEKVEAIKDALRYFAVI